MKRWFPGIASILLLLGLIVFSGTVFNPRTQFLSRGFAMLPYTGQWAGYYTITGPQKQSVRCQMIVQLRPDGRCYVLFGQEDAPLISQPNAVKREGETLLLYTPPRDLSAREKDGIFTSRLTFSDNGKYATLEPLKVSYSDLKGQRYEKSLEGTGDMPIVTLERLAAPLKN